MENNLNGNLPASFKTSPVEFNQSLLFPSNIFDLLPEDHECYLYKDLFEQIDTSAVESKYSHKGQNAYHPKLLVSILIYAYSRGVFSSRQIEKRSNEDLSFMFIAQMNCPNFRVLSDFRKDHADFFHDCFKQTVKLANGQISVDEAHQIIVGQHLSQNANDKQEIDPALKSIEEATGKLPDVMGADNGYMSGDNLEALEEIAPDRVGRAHYLRLI